MKHGLRREDKICWTKLVPKLKKSKFNGWIKIWTKMKKNNKNRYWLEKVGNRPSVAKVAIRRWWELNRESNRRIKWGNLIIRLERIRKSLVKCFRSKSWELRRLKKTKRAMALLNSILTNQQANSLHQNSAIIKAKRLNNPAPNQWVQNHLVPSKKLLQAKISPQVSTRPL